MLTSTAHGLLDDVRGLFGPDEGGRVRVPLVDIAFDMADERADGFKRATAHRLARQNAEPRLDHVEPRRAFRREVELDPGMRGQPGLHRWCGVRSEEHTSELQSRENLV